MEQLAILVVSAWDILTEQLVLMLVAHLVMFVYTDNPYKKRVKAVFVSTIIVLHSLNKERPGHIFLKPIRPYYILDDV